MGKNKHHYGSLYQRKQTKVRKSSKEEREASMLKDEGWLIKMKAKGKYYISMLKDIITGKEEVMLPFFFFWKENYLKNDRNFKNIKNQQCGQLCFLPQ